LAKILKNSEIQHRIQLSDSGQIKHGTNRHALVSPVLYVDLSAAVCSPDFPTSQVPCTPITSRLTHIIQLSIWLTSIPLQRKNVKSFPSHKAHRAALISVSLAISQTPVYTARPRTRG